MHWIKKNFGMNVMTEWFSADATGRGLDCIMNGCKPCKSKLYCQEHDKPCKDNAPSIPLHCESCGEFIMDEKRDIKGMFG